LNGGSGGIGTGLPAVKHISIRRLNMDDSDARRR
jgi:hypothetical protein